MCSSIAQNFRFKVPTETQDILWSPLESLKNNQVTYFQDTVEDQAKE